MPTLTRAKRGSSRFSKFPEARNIRNQAYKLVKNVLYNRSKFTNYRENRNENYLLMNNNNKTVLGFAFVENPENGNGMLRLTLIGTLPGKGYGRQIMNAIYANAKKEGRNGVTIVNAVTPAQPFYRKMGYTPVAPNNYRRLMHRYVSPKRSPSRSPSRKRKRNSSSPNRRN